MDFTLHELACLDAVLSEGSFQAAAQKLHRSHPAIHSAIKHLEERLGLVLLDRTHYRVRLTLAGEAFHRHAQSLLEHAAGLSAVCEQLQRGEETDLRVVVGDLTPTREALGSLKRFFQNWPRTRLHLHFEVIGGPWERLLAEEADLIIHHIDKSDSRFEWVDLMPVEVVPVIAPSLLAGRSPLAMTREMMRAHVQVIIRDSARVPGRDYFLIRDAASWTVADQHTKKGLILEGMGWGHMPLHLVCDELASGALLSLEGQYFRRSRLDIVAARLSGRATGPVASALWAHLSGASD
ncbi:LysR family transcriptional regulator [Chromobacterium sp. IIBBL 290-4]|uniref:LysR family transcriptional regulator n=1 Tax=Chromobacterium sp. IIBBL 290-4 TaxID=2953890 RepID=UPI0020B7680F|nr:LysR family transcriptional regulator [Chromobacterium sp. IIBBL 290-4]UTH72333.1 LysR family transcriptional regulator [Chromobacterium sp. IIBBL 290-4]